MGMRQIKIRVLSSTVFINMFLSFVIAFIIPLSIVGIISYNWASDVAEKEIRFEYTRILENVKVTIDGDFKMLDAFSLQLAQTPWINKLLNMREGTLNSRVNALDMISYINQMAVYSCVNDLADHIAIYFTKQDVVISDYYRDSLETFFIDNYHYKNISFENWKEILSERNDGTILPFDEVKRIDKSEWNYMTYIQSIPKLENKFCGVLLYFIDSRTFHKRLNTVEGISTGSLYILDENDELITGINLNTEFIPQISNMLKSGENSNGIITLKAQQPLKYMSFTSISRINRWKYVMLIPFDSIAARGFVFKYYIFTVLLLSIAIGLLLSYSLARKNFNPLLNVVKTVNNGICKSQTQDKNEYRLLTNSIKRLFEDTDLLKSQIRLYLPLAQNRYIHMLLNREIIDEEEACKLSKGVSLSFVPGYFFCQIMQLENSSMLLEDIQKKIICEAEKDNVYIAFTQMGANSYIITVNIKYSGDCKCIANTLCERLRLNGIVYRFIGTGSPYSKITDLWKSYNEAKKALDRHFFGTNTNTIFYYDKKENENQYTAFYYDLTKEEKIINFIRSGNYAGATNIALEILEHNANTNRLPTDALKFIGYDLLILPFRVLESMNMEVGAIDLMAKLNELDSFIQLKECVCHIYQLTCSKINERKDILNSQIVEKIVRYVELNFTAYDMSLISVSDYFNMSPSHLSRLFKKATGENFSDYINRMRIEYAKALLKENITISDVVQKTGFANDVTLRRLFKKYLGVTPGMYRDKTVQEH